MTTRTADGAGTSKASPDEVISRRIKRQQFTNAVWCACTIASDCVCRGRRCAVAVNALTRRCVCCEACARESTAFGASAPVSRKVYVRERRS
eukprot:6199585-Pleurochrysis_carterae.AAC.7